MLPSSLAELGLRVLPLSTHPCHLFSKALYDCWMCWLSFKCCHLVREMIYLLIHLNIKNIRQHFSKMCCSVSSNVGAVISLLSEAQVWETFITESSIVFRSSLAEVSLSHLLRTASSSGSSFSPSFLLHVSPWCHGLEGTQGCIWLFCTMSKDQKQWDNLILFHSTPEVMKYVLEGTCVFNQFGH